MKIGLYILNGNKRKDNTLYFENEQGKVHPIEILLKFSFSEK